MISRVILFITLCLCATAQAEIYRYQDANGHTVYTDKPHTGAKKLKLRPLPSYEIDKNARQNNNAPVEKAAPRPQYESVSITHPKANQTLWSAAGEVTVDVEVAPKLMNGDKVHLWVNGKLEQQSSSTTFKLTGLNRGAYRLQVKVVDIFGTTVLTSKQTAFFLQKPSRL